MAPSGNRPPELYVGDKKGDPKHLGRFVVKKHHNVGLDLLPP